MHYASPQRPGAAAEKPRAGTQKTRAGAQKPRDKTPPARAGTQKPRAGAKKPCDKTPPARAGAGKPRAGTQKPRAGNQRPRAGTPPPRAKVAAAHPIRGNSARSSQNLAATVRRAEGTPSVPSPGATPSRGEAGTPLGTARQSNSSSKTAPGCVVPQGGWGHLLVPRCRERRAHRTPWNGKPSAKLVVSLANSCNVVHLVPGLDMLKGGPVNPSARRSPPYSRWFVL